jgi:acetyl esterase
MPLDSATSAFLAASAEAAAPDATPLWELDPAEARRINAGMNVLYGTGPEMLKTQDLELTGIDGGPFQVRVHIPIESPEGVFVYLHGGGWVLGDIEAYDTLGRQLAEKSGCAVILVNYRKAPEWRYPIAVEDSWTALLWAEEHLDDLAGRPVPLFVGGDSAGGNLAAVMALRARDNNGPQLAKQFLIYPVTDADFSRASYLEAENQTMLTTTFMQRLWDHYVPDPQDRTHHEASPLRAETLEGVAPALVMTAAHDVLRDEGEAYAQRLKDAGVPVEYRCWAGQMHGFFQMVNILPGATESMDFLTRNIRGALNAAHR